ncbi:MAG: aminopeptidase P family N-terminal domain-containing protein [Hyphomicrobiales bacterium]
MRQALVDKATDAVVLTDPSSVAWLFNIRGGDVPHTPLVLAFAIVGREYGRRNNIDAAGSRPISLRRWPKLSTFVWPERSRTRSKGSAAPACWLIPPGRRCRIERLAAAGATVVAGADPCVHPKAIKNDVEIDSARAACPRRCGHGDVSCLARWSGAGHRR